MSDNRSFNGRPIAYWKETRTSGDDEARWEATDAIRHLCEPSDSVPLLVDTLLNDSYERARGLAAHALFDLAIDPLVDLRPLRSILPQLISIADPSPMVREEIDKVLALLQEEPDSDR